jgi:hypothetical protein
MAASSSTKVGSGGRSSTSRSPKYSRKAGVVTHNRWSSRAMSWALQHAAQCAVAAGAADALDAGLAHRLSVGDALPLPWREYG